MKKIILPLLLSFLICFGAVGMAGCAPSEKLPSKRLGLYVADDGTLMKDEKPFYGIGVNYYSLFTYTYTGNKWNTNVSEAGLETLKNSGVEVIRFSAAPFHANEMDYYFKRKEKYYETMDKIVKKAESLQMGLIASIFWTDNISNYFDEGYATSLRDPDTKSYKHMMDYTKEIVTRYKDSPAIYGWEFSNERSLSAQLPNWNEQPTAKLPPNSTRVERTEEEDKVLFSDLNAFYKVFANTINSCDPHKRFIGNGDAALRPSSYNQMTKNDWGTDTLEQNMQVLELLNPEGINAISSHMYAPESLTTITNPNQVTNPNSSQPYLGLFSNWDEYLTHMNAQSKKMKKTYYLGETGYNYMKATALDWSSEVLTYPKIKNVFDTLMKAFLNNDVPLALIWNYDPIALHNNTVDPTDKATNATEWSWSENTQKGKDILELIKQYNTKIQEKHAS